MPRHSLEVLLNCYARELALDNIEETALIAEWIVANENMLEEDMSFIATQLITLYQQSHNESIRSTIYNTLKTLHENATSEHKRDLQTALAACAQASVDTQKFTEQQLNDLVDTLGELHEGTEHTSLKETEKYTNALLLRANAHFDKKEFEAALEDYQKIYETNLSHEVLTKIAHIETVQGDYKAATENYQFLADCPDISIQSLQMALTDLAQLYEELATRDSRREGIRLCCKKILVRIITDENTPIKSYNDIEKFNSFLQLVGEDADLEQHIKALRDKIAPQEEARIAAAKQQTEHIQSIQKKIDVKGRSSELQLATLLALLENEKDNKEGFRIVQAAINTWIENAVIKDNGNIGLRNENGIIDLAKRSNIIATYYLAKYLEGNELIDALSLYARICLIKPTSANEDKVRKDAWLTLKNFAAPPSKGIAGLFPRQQQARQYAADLFDVVSKLTVTPDPDTAIQAALHEANHDVASYSNYVVSVSKILGIKAEATPHPSAQRRHAAGTPDKP